MASTIQANERKALLESFESKHIKSIEKSKGAIVRYPKGAKRFIPATKLLERVSHSPPSQPTRTNPCQVARNEEFMYALAKAEHEQKTWVWVACYKSTHPGLGERDALISALDLLIEDEHIKALPGSLKVSNPTGIPA
jgi:hypothetical protein